MSLTSLSRNSGIDSKKIAKFKDNNPRKFEDLWKPISIATYYRDDLCLYSKPLSLVINPSQISLRGIFRIECDKKCNNYFLVALFVVRYSRE